MVERWIEKDGLFGPESQVEAAIRSRPDMPLLKEVKRQEILDKSSEEVLEQCERAQEIVSVARRHMKRQDDRLRDLDRSNGRLEKRVEHLEGLVRIAMDRVDYLDCPMGFAMEECPNVDSHAGMEACWDKALEYLNYGHIICFEKAKEYQDAQG